MFEVGERVVCVDARWPTSDVPLVQGKVYTVARIFLERFPGNFLGDTSSRLPCLHLLEVVHPLHEIWGDDAGFDIRRFRKLRNLDTSQSLQALIDLPSKVKNGELVSCLNV